MRWRFPLGLLFLVVMFLPAVNALDLWGCCVPPVGVCFAGSGAFSDEDAFRSACTQVGGQIRQSGILATCEPLTRGPPETAVCEQGCCCAGSSVFDSPTINSDEELLRSTRAECSLAGSGYSFATLPSGSSCVAVCGGSGPTTSEPQGNITVLGYIKNATNDARLSGATVYVVAPGGQISTTSADDGSYTLEGLAQGSTRIFASHPSCRPGQTAPLLLSQNTAVNISLDCTRQVCEASTPAVSGIALMRGTDKISFTADLPSSCQSLVHFEPTRCDKDFANCVALPPSVSPAIIDSGLHNGTTYCYRVTARFTGGIATQSPAVSTACIKTGDFECMTRPGDASPLWCGKSGTPKRSAILHCNDNNEIDATLCEGSTVCSSQGETPACVVPPPCDRCNGLLGFFADLSLLIAPEGIDGREITCDQAEEEGICYVDRALEGKPLLIDAYAMCLAMDSCSQYRNPDSCQQNVCGISGGSSACSWSVVNEELGMGVCIGDSAPVCERCDDLFGFCNQQVCESISQSCYFDDEKNGLAKTRGCLSRENMACRYYDTQDDCIGDGGNAVFDIGRDQNGTLVSGSNARTTSSDDLFSFGACSWFEEKNRCIKDADRSLSAQQEDDCFENNRYRNDPECYIDSTPPTTTVFLTDPPIYSRSSIQSLSFRVTDDRSPLSLIKTLVCFAPVGSSCYPSKTLAEITSIPSSGAYKMRFFSIDANGNFETIKEADITLQDSSAPILESIVIEEVG